MKHVKYMSICFKMKDKVDFNIIWKSSAHLNMFWQNYSKNRTTVSFASIHKYVSATIMNLKKKKRFFVQSSKLFVQIP